ncbi:hypothetical protein C8Q77DRAFT_1047446 [Trametes polyzona]|nr:hypothetical protein C8Q77DRAFT_1047446 [Trametes polyzona]
MNRHLGGEAYMGLGGGIVSAESAKNLAIAEDLCRRRRPEEAVPYLMKAMEDPNNLDVDIQIAFLAPTTREGLQMLEKTEERGRVLLKRVLSPTCFDDDGEYAERFWSLLETRPYMRVLQAIVRLAVECKEYNKAADTMIEMLRLCPGDNLGQRYWLGPVLCQAGRYAQALSFAQAWLNLGNAHYPPRGGCKFDPPSQAPLTEPFIQKNKGKGPGGMLYTAALASFKLWGDCEIARQYLKLAASANPHVLLKVLGKVDAPKSLNNLPRQYNGPEEAHDYLWLAQDLWMVPDVWEWADSDIEVKSYVLKKCSRVGCNNREVRVAEFKRCGGCKEAIYCGQTCQREDWKEHKPRCKELQQRKDLMKSMMNPGRPLTMDPTDGPILATADFNHLPAGMASHFRS